MNNRIFQLLLILCFSASYLNAQQNDLKAVLDAKQFYLPEGDTYLETYINYFGSSLVYDMDPVDSLFYAQVATTIVIKKGGDILDFKKFNISSPAQNEGMASDFLDVQRFSLEPGNYEIEVELRDLNDSLAPTKTINMPFDLFPSDKKRVLSDIMLLEAYGPADESSEISKAGYNLLPFVSIAVPGKATQLAFYVELCDFSNDSTPTVAYTGIHARNGDAFGELQRIKRLKDEWINPLLQIYPIENLPAGQYDLVVEMRNSQNEPVVKKILPFVKLDFVSGQDDFLEAYNENQIDSLLPTLFFQANTLERKFIGNAAEADLEQKKLFVYEYFNQRSELPKNAFRMHAVANYSDLIGQGNGDIMFSEDYKDREQVYDFVLSLKPIAGSIERATIDYALAQADLSTLQEYLFYFWQTRNSEMPEKAWKDYLEQVNLVDREFGTANKKGYETDRGRVYLQYGAPNTRVRRYNDTDTYPYEIWHYYKIGQFNDGKFVFYNPSLGIQDFPILHCNIRGEINNKQWVKFLYSGNENVYDPINQSTQVDGRQDINFRNRPLDFYNNPR